MDKNKLNIKKTKYRYLIDNLVLFPINTILTYTIPVPKGEETKEDEYFDRNYPDVKISNIKFKHMVDKTAKALIAFGIKKGDIVTVCHTNTPETLYMDYALSKIGAVPNYIYPNLTSDEIKYFINELDSKYLFMLDDEPIRKNVKEATKDMDIKIISSSVIESFPSVFKYVANKKNKQNNQSKTKIKNEIRWKDFIKNGKDALAFEVDYEPNKICTYIHTSGTSSVPKAVKLSNENVNSATMNFNLGNVRYQIKDSLLQTIPQFVSYGIATNHLALCNNQNIIMIPEMEPKNFYDLVKKYSPSHSFTTPSHARELIKRETDMSNTKNFFFGGDGFDDVEKKMNDYIKKNGGNAVAYQGYGSTEVSAAAINTTPDNYRFGSIGKPIGKTEVVLIEPGTFESGNFNVIDKPNTVGEAYIGGPGVTLGYAGENSSANDEVYVKFPNGKIMVKMGDLLSFDEDGFYYYHGRLKNVITRKSFTFSPDEIVNAIMKHPNVKQCVVVPKYSKEEGETPSAHITLNNYDNIKETMDEIIELVNLNVQEFHRPTDYKIREEIIRNRNNKNNIIALKIEDTARLYDGVLDAKIKNSSDNNYEYELEIEVNENIVTSNPDELVNDIKKHIEKISNIIKFNVGAIKYNIRYLDANYLDADYSNELDRKKVATSYVKHI